jgi:hypothetical protein
MLDNLGMILQSIGDKKNQEGFKELMGKENVLRFLKTILYKVADTKTGDNSNANLSFFKAMGDMITSEDVFTDEEMRNLSENDKKEIVESLCSVNDALDLGKNPSSEFKEVMNFFN